MKWKDEVKRLRGNGLSWREIAESMRPQFPTLSYAQVWNKCRDSQRTSNKNKVIGVFSDVHIPFQHPNYLQFLQDTFKKYKVTDIVCLGDLVDHHALSRFQSEPGATGAYDELDMALDGAKQFVEAFPEVKMCEGNHDCIPKRQAATLGIGERFLKPLKDLLNLPEEWEIKEEYIIDDVLYKHGLNCGGKDGALNAAINEQISTVIGHYHSFGGVKYIANKRNLIFGMNTGCGVDVSAYAFAYGKHSKFRPTLGCGIVVNSSKAFFVPMGKEYFRGDDK